MKKAVGIFIMAICLVGLSLTTLYAEVIEVTYLPLYVVANSPYTTPVAQTVVLIGATTGTRITGLTTANFTLRGAPWVPLAITYTVTPVGGGVYTITYKLNKGYTWPPASSTWNFIVKIMELVQLL